MDPVIEELTRYANQRATVRVDVLRRCAEHLRTVVQPQLDELAALKTKRKKADEAAA